MSNLSPIVLFVYNRLDHVKQTIDALQKNTLASESKLIIYSDNAKNSSAQKSVDDVRSFIATIDGFKSVKIIKRDANLGLAKSIISGVSEVVNKYKRVIVLEHDLITSSDFLEYMNKGLDFYKNNEDIFSITGSNYLKQIPEDYDHDLFLFYRACSWGWATWEDRWKKVDWQVKNFNSFIKNKNKVALFNRGGDDLSDTLTAYMKGKIDVWAIRWSYAHFENNKYCLYPVNSKIENIGFDGSGENCTSESKFFSAVSKAYNIKFHYDMSLDSQISSEFQKLHKYNLQNKIKQLVKKIVGYYDI